MFYNFIEYFTELHTRHGNNYGYISYKAFIGRGPGIYFFEFIISTKPEVSEKSLILITYLMVPNIPEHSRIIGYDKTYA